MSFSYAGLFADKVNGTIEIDLKKEGTKVSFKVSVVPLSDVMGLSSHIVNCGEGKYDNIVATFIKIKEKDFLCRLNIFS